MAQVEVNADRVEQAAGVVQGDVVRDQSTRLEININGAGAQNVHIGAVYSGTVHFHVRLDVGGAS